MGKIVDKLKNIGTKTLDDINPTVPKTPDRIIKIICALLCVSLLYNLYNAFGFIRFVFTNATAKWDRSVAYVFFPYIYLPITIYFLLKKSKIGWTMFSVWLTFSTLTGVYGYISELNLYSTPGFMLFAPKGFAYYLAVVLFFGSLLFYFNTKSIKEIFAVERKRQLYSIGLTAIATTIQWWPLIT